MCRYLIFFQLVVPSCIWYLVNAPYLRRGKSDSRKQRRWRDVALNTFFEIMQLSEEDYCDCDSYSYAHCNEKKCLIMKAVFQNDVVSLTTLLDSPKWYNVRCKSGTPMLNYAVTEESKEVFDYLLSLDDYPLDLATPLGITALIASLSGYIYVDEALLVDIYASLDEDEDIGNISDYYYNGNGDVVEDLIKRSEYYALELIRKGADINQICSRGNTTLHYAMEQQSTQVVELLISKGIDINRQNNQGNTALHLCCLEDRYPETERLELLLSNSAHAMIYNLENVTPFDILLKWWHFEVPTPEPTQRDLVCCILDEYAEYDITLETLLMASENDSVLFYRLIENVREVICNISLDCRKLFSINPSHLQILIEKFDNVLKKAFDKTSEHFDKISFKNFCVLTESKVKQEFTEWLRTVNFAGIVESLVITGKPESSVMETVCFLLSHGMTVTCADLDLIYRRFGYCELFKILLHMDVKVNPFNIQNVLMPRFRYYVTVDTVHLTKEIFNKITQRPSFLADFSIKDMKEVLSYYAVPLSGYCFNGLKNSKAVLKKAQKQPRVPLLVELARNEFRTHLVKTLNIRSIGQFYTLVKSLPISICYKKIITLEKKLY